MHQRIPSISPANSTSASAPLHAVFHYCQNQAMNAAAAAAAADLDAVDNDAAQPERRAALPGDAGVGDLRIAKTHLSVGAVGGGLQSLSALLRRAGDLQRAAAYDTLLSLCSQHLKTTLKLCVSQLQRC